MTIRYANVLGVSRLDSLGTSDVRAAVVTFDLGNVGFTGGSDTVTLGSAGWVDGEATTLSLAQMVGQALGVLVGQTVSLYDLMRGPPGQQEISTGGPLLYAVTPTLSAGNITGVTLMSAITGGSAVTTMAVYWDRPASFFVNFTVQ